MTNTNEPFILRNGDLQIRSSISADIESYIHWYTVETEWLRIDSPWDDHQSDPDEIRERLTRILSRPKPEVWSRLQICLNYHIHLGSVSAYINEVNGEDRRYVGIFIGEKNYWGKGLGEQALKLWLAYLFNITSEESVFCGTWSGNIGMIKLAAKCGFVEIDRKKNLRQVNGQNYDGLTFQLNKDNFTENSISLINDVKKQLANPRGTSVK